MPDVSEGSAASGHELFPAGQSAGLIRDILRAGEIVRRVVAEARQALERSIKLLT
jgi:NAD(P)H-dependent flavin oxidoreductase YrpB (nitropropane dioxygenase family)